jgi:hypothetical protein
MTFAPCAVPNIRVDEVLDVVGHSEDWREVREWAGEPDVGELDKPDLGEWETEPAELPEDGPTRPPMAGGVSPAGAGEGSSSPPPKDEAADASDGKPGPGQEPR